MEKVIVKEEILNEKDYVVELSGLVDYKLLSTNLDQYNFLEIQSSKPILQIGNLIFQGSFEPFLGTAVCFQQQKNSNVSDDACNLEYLSKTDTKLLMKRVYLQKNNTNLDEKDLVNDDEDSKFKQINCNLGLQMALYFNIYFVLFWIIFHLTAFFQKYNKPINLGLFLQLIALTIISFIEIPRIYLGYLGNLRSQILSCLGFWLLTLIIQFPVLIFLLSSTLVTFCTFEILMHSILLSFYLIELVFGFKLLKNLLNNVM